MDDTKQLEAVTNPKKLASFSDIALMDEAVRDALTNLTKHALDLADAVKPVKTATHPDVTISRRTSRFEVTGFGNVKMDTSDGITSEWNCGWRTIEFAELRPGDIFRLWDRVEGVWCPDHYREDGAHDTCVVLSEPFEVTSENGTKTLSVETFRVNLHLPKVKVGRSIGKTEMMTDG